MNSFEERRALLKSADRPYPSLGSIKQTKCKVYKRRWYILIIFSIVASLNNIIWNTWGPIQGTAQVVFGWDTATIALLADWGPISYVVAVLPMTWLMSEKGLRSAVVLAAVFEFVGAGLRCFPNLGIEAQTWMIHLGQFITGIGGPVAMAAPPLVSAAWFPPEQRTTATAISSLACYSGTALSFVIGPLLVPDVGKLLINNGSQTEHTIDYKKIRNNLTDAQYYHLQGSIMNLMYVEIGVVTFILLCVLIYFPKKPKHPPSVTAATGRLDFNVGLKKLVKSGQFWLLVLIYGVGTGIYGGWCSVLDLNLSEFGVSQSMAGWLGFWAVLAGSISGISLSIFADHFTRHMKTITLFLLAGATAALLVFSLICVKVIPYSEVLMYFTCALGGFCVNGTIPLFFELGVESTYPVPEGITSGFLTFSNNFIQVIFYIFPMVPHFGTKWINWCTFASTALCIPLLICWKEKYYRSDVDKKGNFSVSASPYPGHSQESVATVPGNGQADQEASLTGSLNANGCGATMTNSLASTADISQVI